jgi:hypothetical protein
MLRILRYSWGYYFFSGLLFMLLPSCSDSDFPKVYKLESFRILALIADHPEVNPGDTVIVTPLISDITGGGRTIMFSAQACVDPGIGSGADPTCESVPSKIDLITQATVTGLTAPNYTGEVTSKITVIVPTAEVIFAQTSTAAQLNGVNYLLTVQFFLPDGSKVSSVRRIAVSSNSIKNQNPVYEPAPILSAGAPLTSLPNVESSVQVDLLAGAADEIFTTAWYISDGDLAFGVTNGEEATTYTPPVVLPTSHNVIFVVITRDERGGVVAQVLTL